METRLREYKELKNTLVDLNCYADGMKLQDMRNMLQDLHLEDVDGETNYLEKSVQQASNELLSKPLQSGRVPSALKNKWSPLWSRDETNRLKRKDKTQPKNIATVISTSKSPSWQRVEYGCVQNKRYNVNAFQNGRTLNSTIKKSSYQAAPSSVATLSPVEQIQEDVLNTAIRNSPNLVPENFSPQCSKNGRILNSTLKNSSYQAAARPVTTLSPAEQIQDDVLNTTIRNSSNLVPENCRPQCPKNGTPHADDGCHVTLSNSRSYCAFWSPLWKRSEGRRLERKHYITDFDLTSFSKKRNFSKIRNADSEISVANGHETEKKIASNDGTNNLNKSSKSSPNKLNLNIAINNGNVHSSLSLNKNNDKDEDVGHSDLSLKNNNNKDEDVGHHSQISNSSADLTDNQHNSPKNLIEELDDTAIEHSNNTSRSAAVNDVDRSLTISETSSVSDDGNHIEEILCISFDTDDDGNCPDNISPCSTNSFETLDSNQNNSSNENSNHFLSTLYEEEESIDDYIREQIYLEISFLLEQLQNIQTFHGIEFCSYF